MDQGQSCFFTVSFSFSSLCAWLAHVILKRNRLAGSAPYIPHDSCAFPSSPPFLASAFTLSLPLCTVNNICRGRRRSPFDGVRVPSRGTTHQALSPPVFRRGGWVGDECAYVCVCMCMCARACLREPYWSLKSCQISFPSPPSPLCWSTLAFSESSPLHLPHPSTLPRKKKTLTHLQPLFSPFLLL